MLSIIGFVLSVDHYLRVRPAKKKNPTTNKIAMIDKTTSPDTSCAISFGLLNRWITFNLTAVKQNMACDLLLLPND